MALFYDEQVERNYEDGMDFTLARLFRVDALMSRMKRMRTDQTAFEERNESNLPDIKRFVVIDRPWSKKRIIKMIQDEDIAWLDEKIDKYQKLVDDNPAEPGASRKKEIRKEKERERGYEELKHLLAARCLKAEYDRLETEGLRTKSATSLGSEDWFNNPGSTEKLLIKKKARIEREKRTNKESKEAFQGRIKAIKAGSKTGHWAFKDDVEETLARNFLKKDYDGGDDPITADVLYEVQKAQQGVSVYLSIELEWISDEAPRPVKGQQRRPSSTKSPGTEDDSTDIEEFERELARLAKKSLIVKLKIDPTRLARFEASQNVEKRQRLMSKAKPLPVEKKSLIIKLKVDPARLAQINTSKKGKKRRLSDSEAQLKPSDKRQKKVALQSNPRPSASAGRNGTDEAADADEERTQVSRLHIYQNFSVTQAEDYDFNQFEDSGDESELTEFEEVAAGEPMTLDD